MEGGVISLWVAELGLGAVGLVIGLAGIGVVCYAIAWATGDLDEVDGGAERLEEQWMVLGGEE
jgi:hypothetical protein